MAVLTGRLAAQTVDGAIARGGDDPASWRWRVGPTAGYRQRRCERVLDRVLGPGDGAEHPDQDRHGAPVLLAEDTLDLRVGNCRHGGRQSSSSSWNGRTSIGSVVARA